MNDQLRKDLEEVIRLMTKYEDVPLYRAVAGAIDIDLLAIPGLDLSNDYFIEDEHFRYRNVYFLIWRAWCGDDEELLSDPIADIMQKIDDWFDAYDDYDSETTPEVHAQDRINILYDALGYDERGEV